MPTHPAHPVYYGPQENCTLDTCDVRKSVYGYRPSLAANVTLLVLFALSMFIHTFQGIKWREWFFMGAMICGCLTEILGYGGRLILYQNPFSFPGFLLQIICITIGPAFMSAAIYVTLSKIVVLLGPQYSYFRPNFYYWIFISCDLVSLILQATGGALSSTTSGASQSGVDTAIAGLSFQVFTLVVFIALSSSFAVRYARGQKLTPRKQALPTTFKVFVALLGLAILLILVRCVYRIDELSNGYSGPLIKHQNLFIGLEGVMIIVAAFLLNIAHPGYGLRELEAEGVEKTTVGVP